MTLAIQDPITRDPGPMDLATDTGDPGAVRERSRKTLAPSPGEYDSGTTHPHHPPARWTPSWVPRNAPKYVSGTAIRAAL
jgi:hypothetical protein